MIFRKKNFILAEDEGDYVMVTVYIFIYTEEIYLFIYVGVNWFDFWLAG